MMRIQQAVLNASVETLRVARERAKVGVLGRWSRLTWLNLPERRSGGLAKRHSENFSVGVMAGYGNTSYGDYFIGLGLASALRDAGYNPVIVGRDADMRAFSLESYDAVALPDRASGLRSFVELCSSIDGLILGGGGLFEDRVDAVESQSLAAGYAARALYFANQGSPMGVYGVGVEQEPYRFAATERVLRECFNRAKGVGVRDSDSVIACRRFGIEAEEVVDPAVLYLSSIVPIRSESPDGRAGFIPFARRAWPLTAAPDREARNRQYKDWISAAEMLREHHTVVVVPFHSSDISYLGDIKRAFLEVAPAVDVQMADFTPDQPELAVGVLAGCDSVLTMRYHGFMASHFAGVGSISSLGISQKLRVTQRIYDSGSLVSHWDSRRCQVQLSRYFDEVFASGSRRTNRVLG